MAYVLFLKRKQEKLLKWKVPCADLAMVLQVVYQMEVSDYFDSDDIIKWEEKKESDQTFSVVQTFFKNNYDLYVRQSKKNHGYFEDANVIHHVTQWQEQLYAELKYYLEQLSRKTARRSIICAEPIRP